ncbi:MAG: hypothetical protein GF398_04375 [Chitinivibrionales bacterium]|nr:hypothetical protein [Chitinivibrionales bacterium]
MASMKTSAGFLCLILLSTSLCADDIQRRIDTLLSLMTLDEKITVMRNDRHEWRTGGCPRLNVPKITMYDGPHGARHPKKEATAFPTTIALAASWDRALNREVAEAEATEFRAVDAHMRLGTCVDMAIDPRHGRSSESIGEDPFLGAELGVEQVLGTQSKGIIACLKHFIMNVRENDRKNNHLVVDERSLMELYALPFKACIQRGGAMAVMCAHSRVNGKHCVGNMFVAEEILRNRFGYQYLFCNDWASPQLFISQGDGTLADLLEAGLDLELKKQYFFTELAGLVQNGTVPMIHIDRGAGRVLRTTIASGLMDNKLPPVDPALLNSPRHAALCRRAGARTIVLLKNDNDILPLKKNVTIALIGPNADSTEYDSHGSGRVNPPYVISVRQGIADIAPQSTIMYARGCDFNGTDQSEYAQAKQHAAQADVVVFVGGLDENMEGENKDRIDNKTGLPAIQQDLINELAAVNSNLVVVLTSGGICSVDNCLPDIQGLIYAFYLGQETGNAIGDVLFGDVNPGGKLPVTMPEGEWQLPPFDDNYINDVVRGRGYRWFDKQGKQPLFWFGYGLSYTSFKINRLQASGSTIPGNGTITFSVDVTNTGNRAGDEVVQLYLKDLQSSVLMPVKQLKGFERVSTAAGETKTVSIVIGPEHLCFFDTTTDRYTVEAGAFTAMIGTASNNLPLTHDFDVSSTYVLPNSSNDLPASADSPVSPATLRHGWQREAHARITVYNIKGQFIRSTTLLKEAGGYRASVRNTNGVFIFRHKAKGPKTTVRQVYNGVCIKR